MRAPDGLQAPGRRTCGETVAGHVPGFDQHGLAFPMPQTLTLCASQRVQGRPASVFVTAICCIELRL